MNHSTRTILDGFADGIAAAVAQLKRDIPESDDVQPLPIAAIPHQQPATRGMCAICLDAPSQFAMVPCGHLCLCGVCEAALRPSTCPICRASIERTLKIHDSGQPAPAPLDDSDPEVVWYTPVQIGGQECLRDSHNSVFSIENPDVVLGRWDATYTCENACGFTGSLKACADHKQGCRFDHTRISDLRLHEIIQFPSLAFAAHCYAYDPARLADQLMDFYEKQPQLQISCTWFGLTRDSALQISACVLGFHQGTCTCSPIHLRLWHLARSRAGAES